jgi:hypothetical protein
VYVGGVVQDDDTVESCGIKPGDIVDASTGIDSN